MKYRLPTVNEKWRWDAFYKFLDVVDVPDSPLYVYGKLKYQKDFQVTSYHVHYII